LPFLFDRCIAVQRRFWRAAEQQVKTAGEDDHREHLVQPFGRQVMSDDGAGQCADQRADDGVCPLARVKQFAFVEGETGGGRTEGRTQFVRAQHQMRRQASRQQGRRGQQTATAGDGVDETGNESDKGQNGQGGEVNAEFERHGNRLIRQGADLAAGRAVMLLISKCCGDPSDAFASRLAPTF
jgi:hypothetical protein